MQFLPQSVSEGAGKHFKTSPITTEWILLSDEPQKLMTKRAIKASILVTVSREPSAPVNVSGLFIFLNSLI